jgi:hypothetical protein
MRIVENAPLPGNFLAQEGFQFGMDWSRRRTVDSAGEKSRNRKQKTGGFSMRIFQAMRVKFTRAMLLALFLCVIPASLFAGVFISVNFAPPPLPVLVLADQPPCPEAGLMWTPGYWDYGPDGYFWVPGTWVAAPQVGFLWTPGYWGWGANVYVWHPGYWGPHVGYYGGVNYGFGYMGIGFVGGAWRGNTFAYNTAVVRVNTTVIHNTYVDNTVVRNNTVVDNNHAAYSGGPGGVNHPPTAQENAYSHEQHVAPSAMQTQHETAARSNTNNYASHNGGHPQNVAMERPAGGNTGGNEHRAVNYNSSKSNSGNTTAPHGENGSTNQHPSINYNASKSNTGNAPKTYNSSHSNTGNAPESKTYNASHSNTSNAPESKTYNASHSNTSNAPEHSGGGQQHGQPGMAVKGQGPASTPQHGKPHR